jgi:hypothetical protein
MKALILPLVLVLSLQSQALQGSLEVTQDSLRVVREDGFKVHFYKGEYLSKLTWKKGTAYLSIVRKDITTNSVLKFPPGESIPENGNFSIDGSKTGQTFKLEGSISTQKVNSETIQEQESCQYSQEEYVCRGRRRQECGWETVWYSGLRRVEFYYQTKTTELLSSLISDNGGRGEWSGKSKERNKVFTFIGKCR